ncbi:alpha/beta fold hydrolase [Amycolatopsis sacchari]|uniref:Pimeloyl-ACP methyl ester carboxylesterase n=1 Tax=Amycolatopsis sacchari TaxID=115433 RepID=A0A1I4CSW9_9PSEU|nr:alpha/beta hydrolase [Amycolatopsis sacchari]SFK83883.1 Pimeloyl-ACP methyl ester carboxylesterase [Amycolatopsis sacchari]
MELTRTFDTPDGAVRWDRLGEGPPVVLLHGTPFSSFVWRNVARALAGTHEVFVWDLLGYGASEKRDGQDVSLAAQGRIFAGLLEHWRLDSPAVVAHDFGGAVALRALLLHGARHGRLALVDAVAQGTWGTPFFRLVRENAPVFHQLPPHLHGALVREYVSSASAVGLLPDVRDRLVEPWLGATGQAAFYRQVAQADERYTREIEDRYGSLALPVLVCWGEQDEWLPIEHGERLVARIPGSRLHRVAGAGHLVQEDAPAQLTAALLPFLSGH